MSRIISWFSCGAASAVATKLAISSGEKITVLEASALFGEQNLTAQISNLRKEGFLIKKQSVQLN